MSESQSITVWWYAKGYTLLMVKKKKSRESKAKDTMVETEGDKLSRSVRQEVIRTLGGKDVLPDEWDKTAEN